MAEYLIKGETLTGIADAIREKTGGTDPVAVSDMAGKIAGIEAGCGDIDALIDRSITEISSSSVTSIGEGAFSYSNALTTVGFPVATSIGNYAFYFCNALTTVNFPVATSIGEGAFQYCNALTTVDFPVATSIGDSAFQYCTLLESLLLRGNNVCELQSKTSFNATPIKSGTGYIYVPSALIEQYKVETNWSTYAAQFRALEDYTVDGTVTGELDPAKTGT